MTGQGPLVAMIHSTTAAMGPATAAFAERFPEARLWHLLDDRLIVEAEAAGGVVPGLRRRMLALIEHAVANGADGVLMTCSQYGPVTVDAASRWSEPVMGSDQAMFERVAAMRPRRVAVLASLESSAVDSTERLRSALRTAAPDAPTEVIGVFCPGALAAASSGDREALLRALLDSATRHRGTVDLFVIAQYSLTPVAVDLEAALGTPVLSPTHLGADGLRSRLTASPGQSAGSGTPLMAASPGPVFGCIADDYTGGAEVASAFRRVGLRTMLLFGAPADDASIPECDAIVVALKSRSVPADEAVALSVAVQRWLASQGVRQVYFKYCSTFDSTDAGNIGAVADALLDAAGASLTVICPASPEHGRTVYQGHLFVGDRLLSESPMRDHPLTPMTDSDLVRVLGRQTRHGVSLVPHAVIREGADSVAAELRRLSDAGVRYAVTDAICDEDLLVVASAAGTLPVLTGAAGLARRLGMLAADRSDPSEATSVLPHGRTLILAGSCSSTTLEQVRLASASFPAHRLEPERDPTAAALAGRAIDWFDANDDAATLMISSSVTPTQRTDRDPGGLDPAPEIEAAMAEIARHAVARGVTRLIVAGGETSGAVVRGLGIGDVLVAFEEDIGVPWILATDRGLALLLKSGNFGRPDLFVRAADRAA